MLYRAYFSVPGFGIVLWFWQYALAAQMDDKALWVNARADRAGSYYAWGLPGAVPSLAWDLPWYGFVGMGRGSEGGLTGICRQKNTPGLCRSGVPEKPYLSDDSGQSLEIKRAS